MRSERGIIAYILCTVIGAVLLVVGCAEMVDAFWTGMGSALVAVSVMRMVRAYRLHNDDAYREKYEVEMNDERNQFIRNKAWAWSGCLFIQIAAVACIALKVAGQEVLSLAASTAVCLMLVLYWVMYLVLKRKY